MAVKGLIQHQSVGDSSVKYSPHLSGSGSPPVSYLSGDISAINFFTLNILE